MGFLFKSTTEKFHRMFARELNFGKSIALVSIPSYKAFDFIKIFTEFSFSYSLLGLGKVNVFF